MESVAAGDPHVCRALVQRHLAGVYNLAYRMLGDHGLAEDVAQESFLRLWKQSKRWRPEASIRTWLFRVTHNLAIDELRRRNRHPAVELPETMAVPSNALAAVYRGEISAQIDHALQTLPERQRTAFALVHQEGFGGSEAAAIMGISIEALESLLARARRRLRESLAVFRDGFGEAE
jgi:RNA polymerase sigma-70 factor (ECF subfamily)